jgi:hypothetical protein
VTRLVRLVLVLGLLAATGTSALAQAELIQKDGVRIDVSGQLSPQRLPRQGSAPIAVSVGGQIEPIGAGVVPTLKTLKIDLNRNGRIDSKGLPVCPYDAIQPASSRRALQACRSSLVGRGSSPSKSRSPGRRRTRPRAPSLPSTAARAEGRFSTGRSSPPGPSPPRS